MIDGGVKLSYDSPLQRVSRFLRYSVDAGARKILSLIRDLILS